MSTPEDAAPDATTPERTTPERTTPEPTPPGSVLRPVTNATLTAALDSHGVRYGIDEDGDVAARWDPGATLLFLIKGETSTVLHVMAHFDQRFGMDEVPGLLVYCNEWNRRAMWPKVYVIADGDGADATARLISEVNTEVSAGLSDEQLVGLLDCAISTSLQLSQNLTEWSEKTS